MNTKEEQKEEQIEEQIEDGPTLDINDMREIAKGAYWVIGGISLFACLMIFFMSRLIIVTLNNGER